LKKTNRGNKMTRDNSFKQLWEIMSTPPGVDAITIRPVPQTNAYLAKYFDESFGLFLKDITDRLPSRSYKHIEIKLKPAQQITIPGRGSRVLNNCLILQADNEIKAPLLSLILDCLHDEEPSGQFTALNLVSVLDDVEELMRRPKKPLTLQEVAGAWGELFILSLLVNNSNNHSRQFEILKCWEGETREKLDFRFLFCRQVLEIKSTITSERIHHLHGIEQVTIPPGFENGHLVSLILHSDQGITTLELVNTIQNSLEGTSEEKRRFQELLERRILLRGEACNDDRFSFELAREGLEFFEFENVPTPGEVEGVSSIEWLSDLSSSSPLNSRNTDDLISRITVQIQESVSLE